MTIEEKARAYDEAIKIARIWKDKSGMPKDKQGILDDIFPELRESEDEKIRKEIINYFKCLSREEPTRKDTHNKWIAWLEEQGDKKPIIEGTFVNVDEVREDFMQEVYRFLDDDSNNDRANQIIDAFDNLPTIDFKRKN